MNTQDVIIPAHVPAGLVKNYDYVNTEGLTRDPYRTIALLHEQEQPIFWNPLNTRHDGRGTWDIVKASYQREALGDPETFSSDLCAGFSAMIGEEWRLNPLEIDPPQHAKYRKLLNPLVSPVAVAKLQQRMADRAEELVDAVVDQGGCEFMEAFGRPFPISIIMQLIGVPMEDINIFLKWAYDLLHNPDMAAKIGAATDIRDFLHDLMIERRARPQDDFASHVIAAEIDGRKITEGEIMGILYLLFVGGLDTVASSLGFQYHHLGLNMQDQRFLRQNPEAIPVALEEFLRRFAVVMTARRVTRDIEFHGVSMEAGDWVSIPMQTSSVDPVEYENPLEIDFNRGKTNHMAFSFGPHFCMGVHIARREMIIALQKWTTMVPEFKVTPNSYVEMHGGGVFGVEHLELQW
jgi:cytochrome P450